MDNISATLSADDVVKLVQNPSADARVEVLEKVSYHYLQESLSAHQMEVAEEIFRALVHDAEVKVRKALAENLKDSTQIPKDVVMDLVKDVDEVAVPVLQYSEVLDDDDLVAIIGSADSGDKLMAISNRDEVSENISDALVETKHEAVVQNLLERPTVKFSKSGLGKVFDYFSENNDMVEKLVKRDELPVDLTEKMMTRISGRLQEILLEKYGERTESLKDIFNKSREAATLQFMGMKDDGESMSKLVDELDKSSEFAQDMHERSERITRMVEELDEQGKLSPLSALCMGHVELFEISVARVTRVPLANVRKLLTDATGEGFRALYKKARLPDTIYDAMRLVHKVVRDMEKDYPDVRKPAHAMISNIMTHAEREENEIENLSYFINLIHKHNKKSE